MFSVPFVCVCVVGVHYHDGWQRGSEQQRRFSIRILGNATLSVETLVPFIGIFGGGRRIGVKPAIPSHHLQFRSSLLQGPPFPHPLPSLRHLHLRLRHLRRLPPQRQLPFSLIFLLRPHLLLLRPKPFFHFFLPFLVAFPRFFLALGQGSHMDPRHHLRSQHSLVLGSASLTQALHQTNCLRCDSLLHRHPYFPQRLLVRRMHPRLVLQHRFPPRVSGYRHGLRLLGDWGRRVDLGCELASRGAHCQHNRGRFPRTFQEFELVRGAALFDRRASRVLRANSGFHGVFEV